MMPKKKPEMSQIYNQSNNEFIFGENGGRGKNLSSFLKNLSLMGSSSQSKQERVQTDDFRKINSSIYGNMAYGYDSPDQGGSTIPKNGSGFNSSDFSLPSRHSPKRISSSSSVRNMSPLQRSTSRSDAPSPSPMFLSQSHVSSVSGDNLRSTTRKVKYADLDDDWDAQLEEKSTPVKPTTQEGNNSSARPPSASDMLDSLHPDLVLSSTQSGSYIGESWPKNSMDSHDTRAQSEVQRLNRLSSRFSKFTKILVDDGSAVNIQDLRKLSWNGIPSELRALTWQLLLGYLPTNKTRQFSILKRKRQEYLEGLSNFSTQFLSNEAAGAASTTMPDSKNRDNSVNKEKQLYHQINIDVKRTNQNLKLYSYEATQSSLRKILYLWAIRHPASGYVQGINDLCTPFYQIFLNNYLWQLQRKRAHEYEGADDDSALFIPGLLDENDSDPHETEIYNDPQLKSLSWENFDPSRLSSRVTAIIEADSYWCISRLLDNITDNYIHEQPGIIKQVNDLQDLISKIDLPLLQHLEHEGVQFIQFSFRWMNCLLMRELSIDLIVRMWDTYLSETPLGFNSFHIYVCAAFLIKFSSELKEKDFQDILLFLQNPPTSTWNEKDIELMLSEAFIWQSLYKNAGARLR